MSPTDLALGLPSKFNLCVCETLVLDPGGPMKSVNARVLEIHGPSPNPF